MDFTIAQDLVMARYRSLHPRPSWPDWFSSRSTCGGTRDSDKAWLMSITVPLLTVLGPHQRWETVDGNKVVFDTDPATGKQSVLISIAPRGVVIAFQARVNPATGAVDVLVDRSFTEVEAALSALEAAESGPASRPN